jgi:riboflavin synthase
MFTGIIHHSGIFRGFRLGKKEMAVEAPTIPSQLEVGESVNVNGVCLSLIRKENRILYYNLSRETLQRTTLGSLRPGAVLNLELGLTLSTPLSGHLVAGHVDFTAKVLKMVSRKPGKRLTLSLPLEFRPYLIPKGSVAVNGVSLTVASLGPSSFDVELIPITLEKSNLTGLRTGDAVNVECDMIGKYVYNWITQGKR